jgi:hypothetical protein
VADDERTGLSGFDAVLLVGAGVVAVLVAFAVFDFIAGLIWFVIKAALVVAVIGGVLWFLFRRRS